MGTLRAYGWRGMHVVATWVLWRFSPFFPQFSFRIVFVIPGRVLVLFLFFFSPRVKGREGERKKGVRYPAILTYYSTGVYCVFTFYFYWGVCKLEMGGQLHAFVREAERKEREGKYVCSALTKMDWAGLGWFMLQ